MKEFLKLNLNGYDIKLEYVDKIFNLYRIEVDDIFVGTFRLKDFIHIYKNLVENNREENEKIDKFYNLIYKNSTGIARQLLDTKYVSALLLRIDDSIYDFKYIDDNSSYVYGTIEVKPNIYGINGSNTYYIFFNDIVDLINGRIFNKLNIKPKGQEKIIEKIEEKFGKDYIENLMEMSPEGFI